MPLDKNYFNYIWTIKVNEYSVAILPSDGSQKSDIKNFIHWEDQGARISVDIKIPKRIPGHYTIMSEIIDVFGQPILELNWNFQATTGDPYQDEIIRRHLKHEPWQHLEAQLASNLWAKSLKVSFRGYKRYQIELRGVFNYKTKSFRRR